MSLELKMLERNDATLVVQVAGEVDVSNADELRAKIHEALDRAPSEVEVDLEGVSYIDSTGIGVLVGAQHHAQEVQIGFTVVHPQHNVARVLSLLGVNEQLGVRS
ncbi:MAG: STAS domain-containing protein [Coriobacteriales bacterium]|nr:STAS domain-containing protein [Coriobacteriales bacterium]